MTSKQTEPNSTVHTAVYTPRSSMQRTCDAHVQNHEHSPQERRHGFRRPHAKDAQKGSGVKARGGRMHRGLGHGAAACGA